MKNYLKNRKLIEVKCNNPKCGQMCMKPNSEYLRNIKLNRKMFCSRSCSISVASTNRSRTINSYNISKHLNTNRDEFTPFRKLLSSCKKRFKECNLTLEYIKSIWDKQNGICPYTGFKMEFRYYSKKNKGISLNMLQASIDRIDPSKGYIEGNIEFVCVPINYLKASFSKEKTLEFLNNFKST